MENTDQLLPPNASPLERAFIHAFSQVIEIDTDIFSNLVNPDTTPTETINTLANDKGIAHWDKEASEQLKRSQIKSAWPSRALSGTRNGIRNAIEGNGFIPRFALDAGTYEVKVTALHHGLSPYTDDSLRVMTSQLKEAINERDVLNIDIGVGATGNSVIGCITQTEIKLVAYPYDS